MFAVAPASAPAIGQTYHGGIRGTVSDAGGMIPSAPCRSQRKAAVMSARPPASAAEPEQLWPVWQQPTAQRRVWGVSAIDRRFRGLRPRVRVYPLVESRSLVPGRAVHVRERTTCRWASEDANAAIVGHRVPEGTATWSYDTLAQNRGDQPLQSSRSARTEHAIRRCQLRADSRPDRVCTHSTDPCARRLVTTPGEFVTIATRIRNPALRPFN